MYEIYYILSMSKYCHPICFVICFIFCFFKGGKIKQESAFAIYRAISIKLGLFFGRKKLSKIIFSDELFSNEMMISNDHLHYSSKAHNFYQQWNKNGQVIAIKYWL